MPRSLDPAMWENLLLLIEAGECLPFIGAGASASVLPTGRTIAREWAGKHNYPLEDTGDLARVAQFLAVVANNNVFPKRLIRDRFAGLGPPDFAAPDEPHAVLAALPLPIYMTTNYDPFMFQALERQPKKSPAWETCVWNSRITKRSLLAPETGVGLQPTVEQPIVYHLHGHLDELYSLVLTEDDYLDFMVKIAEDPSLIPPVIQGALQGKSLLFLGYRLADWDFRVIFHSLINDLERNLQQSHVCVQVEPSPAASEGAGDGEGAVDEEKRRRLEEQRRRSIDYLDKYYGANKITVYWGSAQDFARELGEQWARWKERAGGA